MFNKFRLGTAAVAMVAAFGLATSANAVTASGTAEAVILPALTLAPATGSTLDFGTIAVNGADTVSIDAIFGLTCGTNLVCSGTPSAVTFDVTGGANQTVQVTIPSAAINVTSGTNTMSVDSWNDSTFGGLIGLGAGGSASFEVGGTLHVGAAQAAGTYSGTFSVSAVYY